MGKKRKIPQQKTENQRKEQKQIKKGQELSSSRHWQQAAGVPCNDNKNTELGRENPSDIMTTVTHHP